MLVKRSSKVDWMVAVNTNVPETNATPSTTAMPVNKNRSLWAMSPLRVTFHMVLLAELAHAVQNRVGRRREHLVGDLAVGQEHDAVRVRRTQRIVRDHHDRLLELVHGVAHELEDVG